MDQNLEPVQPKYVTQTNREQTLGLIKALGEEGKKRMLEQQLVDKRLEFTRTFIELSQKYLDLGPEQLGKLSLDNLQEVGGLLYERTCQLKRKVWTVGIGWILGMAVLGVATFTVSGLFGIPFVVFTLGGEIYLLNLADSNYRAHSKAYLQTYSRLKKHLGKDFFPSKSIQEEVRQVLGLED